MKLDFCKTVFVSGYICFPGSEMHVVQSACRRHGVVPSEKTESGLKGKYICGKKRIVGP